MLFRYGLGAVLALTLAAGSVGAYQRLTKQDADQFSAKLNRIVELGKVKPLKTAAPRTTLVSDTELNAYFRHHAKNEIPVGIVEPTINALGDGRMGGRAIVDLDAVRKQKERGWMDPMGYLSGRLPLTATGTLTTKDGIGQFTLESAELSGVTVPKTLIQELLTYYSKNPENPAGINMDAPFELPANIREIRVGKAEATIVQ
jgi:hypothetical protein